MPTVNQPQSAVLGIGVIQKRPVEINVAITIRSMCVLATTIEHLLLDGAVGDQLMDVSGKFLEEYSV